MQTNWFAGQKQSVNPARHVLLQINHSVVGFGDSIWLNLDSASICDLQEAQGWIIWGVLDEDVYFPVSQWRGLGDIINPSEGLK